MAPEIARPTFGDKRTGRSLKIREREELWQRQREARKERIRLADERASQRRQQREVRRKALKDAKVKYGELVHREYALVRHSEEFYAAIREFMSSGEWSRTAGADVFRCGMDTVKRAIHAQNGS